MSEAEVIQLLKANGVFGTFQNSLIDKFRQSGDLDQLLAALRLKLESSKHVKALPFGFKQDMPSEEALKASLLADAFDEQFQAELSSQIQKILNENRPLLLHAVQQAAPYLPNS
jgi:hypothetical protein